jgi:hypothetical protein
MKFFDWSPAEDLAADVKDTVVIIAAMAAVSLVVATVALVIVMGRDNA